MYQKILSFWKSKQIHNSGDLDAVVNGRAVTLAYNTTKLEMADVTFHDTREIFEHGRLLMNYFLVCHDHPVITIHEEDRNEYMSALEAWDVSQDLSLLKEFIKEQAVKTWASRVV